MHSEYGYTVFLSTERQIHLFVPSREFGLQEKSPDIHTTIYSPAVLLDISYLVLPDSSFLPSFLHTAEFAQICHQVWKPLPQSHTTADLEQQVSQSVLILDAWSPGLKLHFNLKSHVHNLYF